MRRGTREIFQTVWRLRIQTNFTKFGKEIAFNADEGYFSILKMLRLIHQDRKSALK